MIADAVPASRTHQWGGAAFVLGNILFLINKLNEMSRLFLGRWMPDLISGQNPALIFLGQVALQNFMEKRRSMNWLIQLKRGGQRVASKEIEQWNRKKSFRETSIS